MLQLTGLPASGSASHWVMLTAMDDLFGPGAPDTVLGAAGAPSVRARGSRLQRQAGFASVAGRLRGSRVAAGATLAGEGEAAKALAPDQGT